MSEVDDLVHIFEKNGIKSLDEPGTVSRCTACNGELAAVGFKDSDLELPEKVLASNKMFFRCASCGKVYWEGSHIHKIRILAKAINLRLRTGKD